MTAVDSPPTAPARIPAARMPVDDPVPAPPAEPIPRRIIPSSRTTWLPRLGAAASSLALTSLLFGRISPLSGTFGFVIVAVILFVVVDTALFALTERGPAVRDRLATTVLSAAAILTFGTLAFVVVYTVARGASALVHLNFFTQDMSQAGPLSGLDVGGIAHALVGTLWTMGIGLAIAVPIGLTGAVFLSQSRGPFAWLVRTTVDAMTALPDIVAGLFIYATWILSLHFEHSGLAAALALAIMMIPIIVRASDLVLRLVSGSLREASAALGAPQGRTVWHVVLPTARSGLTTAVILGAARGIGETAPVLLTAGYTASLNSDPLHGPMVSLPLAAFEFVASPQPTMVARGFGTAAFLMLLVVVLFVIGRAIGGRSPGQVSTAAARRARRVSRRDLARIEAAVALRATPQRPSPNVDAVERALHHPTAPPASQPAAPGPIPGPRTDPEDHVR